MDWESCVDKSSGEGVATIACIPVVIQNLLNFLVVFAGIVLVFIIIFTGYKFVTSEGDPEKLGSARKTLLYAILGFLIVVGAFFILNVISNFTGVSQIAPQ